MQSISFNLNICIEKECMRVSSFLHKRSRTSSRQIVSYERGHGHSVDQLHSINCNFLIPHRKLARAVIQDDMVLRTEEFLNYFRSTALER